MSPNVYQKLTGIQNWTQWDTRIIRNFSKEKMKTTPMLASPFFILVINYIMGYLTVFAARETGCRRSGTERSRSTSTATGDTTKTRCRTATTTPTTTRTITETTERTGGGATEATRDRTSQGQSMCYCVGLVRIIVILVIVVRR